MLINGRTPMTKADIEQVKKNLHACISDECCECSESLCFSCQDYLRASALHAIEHLEQRIEKQNALLAVMGITIPEA